MREGFELVTERGKIWGNYVRKLKPALTFGSGLQSYIIIADKTNRIIKYCLSIRKQKWSNCMNIWKRGFFVFRLDIITLL